MEYNLLEAWNHRNKDFLNKVPLMAILFNWCVIDSPSYMNVNVHNFILINYNLYNFM